MSREFYCLQKSLLVIGALLLACSCGTVAAQENLEKWENFDFAKNAMKAADTRNLSLEDLKFLRGIVFGKHGRVFKDPSIRTYLETRSWYRANPEFQNSLLNSTERQNLDLIRDAEASKHEQIEPGDLRFYRNRIIGRKKLGTHSGAEWLVLRSEIEAIHGKRFDDQPWLQQYFDERYWYTASDHYNPKGLSEIERQNLQTVAAAQKKQRRLSLSPGDMELFENKLISDAMLHGLSLYELRLLRNEIYARHGRLFKAAWLQQYFDTQPWYAVDENFKDEELSGSDKTNVETIVKYENKIHDELSTRPIARALLDGLFIEDASKMRQEIYARHGKVFKESWLQKYFASFDWYKADANFTEASLSEIERKNIATIAAYEKKAVSAMSVIEG